MQRDFSWRPGLLAACAMTLLALLPQAHLLYTRGGDWRGAYASFDGDETAYAAYLAALIAGRPRLNDPYAGLDHAMRAPQAAASQTDASQTDASQTDASQTDAPQAGETKANAPQADARQPESLFSIQFLPAYALALPARALGLRAATVFIALSPLVAFAATLALFSLLALILRDARLAAGGALIILCAGALASGEVSLAPLLKLRASYAYLSFLRRYVPALPFPFLFVFCALVHRALSQPARRRAAIRYAVAAAATFALLVYSYFYLWTTAAAWLVCLMLLWLAARTRDDKASKVNAAKIFLTILALASASLVPYALLLARRAPAMDRVQVLRYTHAPDLFRVPELVGLAALALLAAAVWRGRLAVRDTACLFAASFALTPFLVFNQQLFTGRSLQPVHYADYVLNYLSLLALTLALALNGNARRDADDASAEHLSSPSPPDDLNSEISARSQPRRFHARASLFFGLALAAYCWAAFELAATTRRFAPVNRARDEQAGVAARMAEAAREQSDDAAARPVVLVTNYMLADNLPVGAPQTAVLWSPHLHVFAGLPAAEHRERMYQFFYYTGVAPENFRAHLDANPLLKYMLFGAERVLPRLSGDSAPPLAAEEIEREARAYAAYVAAFTRETAARPALSFVITSPERPYDLSALDRWYERLEGVQVGRYTIQRVRLRP